MPDSRERETGDGDDAGRAFDKNGNQGGYGCTENGSHRSSQAHSSRGERAKKDGYAEAAGDASGQRPQNAVSRWHGRVAGSRQCAHQNQSAKVEHRREEKNVHLAGEIAAEKVACAPGEDGSHAVGSGCELGRGGHNRRG
jgi:hypothetical protein